jgi:homoserine kinase type II
MRMIGLWPDVHFGISPIPSPARHGPGRAIRAPRQDSQNALKREATRTPVHGDNQLALDWDEPRPGLTAEVLATLRDQFALESLTAPRDLDGAFSLNVLMETPRGRFVARVHGSQTSAERLTEIQRTRRHLLAGGVPAPQQVMTRDGAPFVTVGGHLLEVERYVVHDAYMNSWERLEIGLPYLGRTHSLLRSFEVSEAGCHPLIANHIEPNEALAGTLRGVQRLRSLDLTAEERELCSRYEELAYLVDEAEHGIGSTLPRQMVHGDFWDNNVLVRAGAVVLVTDLDFMGERLRVDDLALTLYFANSSIGGDRLSEGRIRELRRLVDAYASGLDEPLSRDERRALPAAIARQPLWSMGTYVVLNPDAEKARAEAVLRAVDVDWTLGLARDLGRWRDAFDG